jgi:hypothetical protein
MSAPARLENRPAGSGPDAAFSARSLKDVAKSQITLPLREVGQPAQQAVKLSEQPRELFVQDVVPVHVLFEKNPLTIHIAKSPEAILIENATMGTSQSATRLPDARDDIGITRLDIEKQPHGMTSTEIVRGRKVEANRRNRLRKVM